MSWDIHMELLYLVMAIVEVLLYYGSQKLRYRFISILDGISMPLLIVKIMEICGG